MSSRAYGGKSVKVKYVAKGFVETVDWKECADLDEDAYHVRIYPASIYPDTPKGKIDMAEKLVNAGLASPVEARAQIYGPESERMQSYHTAPIDDINMQIDRMLYDGEYDSPTKYQDLELGIPMVNSAYLRARSDGAPDDRLSLLLRWLDEADAIRKAIIARANREKMEQLAQAQQLGAGQGPKPPGGGGGRPEQEQELNPPPSQ
jgi:hypothetical protein